MDQLRSIRLEVEKLEPRTLLSTLRGVDLDGDHYAVRLRGPGEIVAFDRGVVEVAGTTAESRLVIRPLARRGDGVVEISNIDTGGASLGKLAVNGAVGGMETGAIDEIRVRQLGRANLGDGEFEIHGSVGSLRVDQNAEGVRLVVEGELPALEIGGDSLNFQVQAEQIGRVIVQGEMQGSGISSDGRIGEVEAALINNSTIRSGEVLDHLLSHGDLIASMISARQAINVIEVEGTSDRNTVMAGLDVGKDLLPGSGDERRFVPIDGLIGIEGCSFRIGRDLIDTIVAVGVDSVDGIFGNTDDVAVTDQAMAKIGMIEVQGKIAASAAGQTVIMAADQIGSVTQGGIQFTGAPGVQVITLRRSG